MVKTCLPVTNLSNLMLWTAPCVAGKHALLSAIVSQNDRNSKRQLEASCGVSNFDNVVERSEEDEMQNGSTITQTALHSSIYNKTIHYNSNQGDTYKETSERGVLPLCSQPTVATIEQHEDKVFALAVAGELLYSASASKDIRVFRAPWFEELDQFGSGNGLVNSLMAFDDRLYSAHQDNKIRVWRRIRYGDTKCKHRLIAVLPRLNHFVVGMMLQRNYVQVRRHKKKQWIEHTDTIGALALGGDCSSDGLSGLDQMRKIPTLLYSASWDKTVKVWSLKDYRCIESFQAHSDAINAMIVIDGCVLVTASADCSIKLWMRGSQFSRQKKHSLLGTFHGHKAAVNALALSSNGRILYSGGSEGAVVAWKRVRSKPSARLAYVSTIRSSSSGTISVSGDEIVAHTESGGRAEMEIDMRGALHSLPKQGCSDGVTAANALAQLYQGRFSTGMVRRDSRQPNKAAANSTSFVMRKMMIGHARAVLSVSTVGDDVVCSSSADKTIRVWRRGAKAKELAPQRSSAAGPPSRRESSWEYECLAVLAGHGAPVKSIASVVYSADVHLARRRRQLLKSATPRLSHPAAAAADKLTLADGAQQLHDHERHLHQDGVVVYSAGLDAKVKVWVIPLTSTPSVGFAHDG